MPEKSSKPTAPRLVKSYDRMARLMEMLVRPVGASIGDIQKQLDVEDKPITLQSIHDMLNALEGVGFEILGRGEASRISSARLRIALPEGMPSCKTIKVKFRPDVDVIDVHHRLLAYRGVTLVGTQQGQVIYRVSGNDIDIQLFMGKAEADAGTVEFLD